MFRPGPRNLITDIPALTVGHASDENARSGVTALLCGAAWSAGVDVRGGGPGGRETDALSPENLVGRAHAVVLAGGSVFGLAAADGVTAIKTGGSRRLTATLGFVRSMPPAAILRWVP